MEGSIVGRTRIASIGWGAFVTFLFLFGFLFGAIIAGALFFDTSTSIALTNTQGKPWIAVHWIIK